jgi:hypothetical protein
LAALGGHALGYRRVAANAAVAFDLAPTPPRPSHSRVPSQEGRVGVLEGERERGRARAQIDAAVCRRRAPATVTRASSASAKQRPPHAALYGLPRYLLVTSRAPASGLASLYPVARTSWPHQAVRACTCIAACSSVPLRVPHALDARCFVACTAGAFDPCSRSGAGSHALHADALQLADGTAQRQHPCQGSSDWLLAIVAAR